MSTTTTYMSLTNPTPSVDSGPGYAINIQGDLVIIDAHDHVTVGKNIVSAAININGDLTFNSFNATNLRAVRMTSQSATLSGGGDVSEIYVVNGDLYYNNGSGTAVKVTSGSNVNVPANANLAYAYLAVSSNHVILANDQYTFFDTDTTSARTFTLPAANSVAAGTYYIFKDKSGSAFSNNITVNRAGSDTIDGATSAVVNVNYGSLILIGNGTNAWRVSRPDAISISGIPVSSSAPTTSKLLTYNGTQWAPTLLVNASVDAAAAIAYSKLNLSGSIVNADVNSSAAIAYSKLALTGSVVNADIGASAGIAYSKLTLTGSIVDGDVSSSAAIAVSKLAAGTANQVLINNGTPTPAWTTLSNDITNVVGSMSVIGLTGAGGIIGIANTGNVLRWVKSTTAPGLAQLANTTNSGTAADMSILAQSATGSSSNGGQLILSSGAGTATDGYVAIQEGGHTLLEVGPVAGGPNLVNIIAGLGLHRVSKSGNYTFDSGTTPELIVYATGASTFTLPAPTDGRILIIKDTAGTAEASPISIVRHGTEKIDGIAAGYTIVNNWGSIVLCSDGTDWNILVKN
jgi:hypothetical protein